MFDYDQLIRLLFVILFVYRLTKLIETDDGPYDFIHNFRQFLYRGWEKWHKHAIPEPMIDDYIESQLSRFYYRTLATLYDGIVCPYCLGLWSALFGWGLYMNDSIIFNSIIFIFGVAGAQHIIERMFDGR